MLPLAGTGEFLLGKMFKVGSVNSGVGCPNRSGNAVADPTTFWAPPRGWTSSPVFGGVLPRRQTRHPQQVVGCRHEVAPPLRSFQGIRSAPNELSGACLVGQGWRRESQTTAAGQSSDPVPSRFQLNADGPSCLRTVHRAPAPRGLGGGVLRVRS